MTYRTDILFHKFCPLSFQWCPQFCASGSQLINVSSKHGTAGDVHCSAVPICGKASINRNKWPSCRLDITTTTGKKPRGRHGSRWKYNEIAYEGVDYIHTRQADLLSYG
jgi:hypothetical protein